ncbi:hypothetical protein HAX54_048284 [Datura stramonium]|uniref:Uncharacterized protein n=1 Tax=Datura stramonium TaxID=4076 RepID=A0ABS8WMX1_DATST|nr:hypothetical protein [Datura stramonium]
MPCPHHDIKTLPLLIWNGQPNEEDDGHQKRTTTFEPCYRAIPPRLQHGIRAYRLTFLVYKSQSASYINLLHSGNLGMKKLQKFSEVLENFLIKGFIKREMMIEGSLGGNEIRGTNQIPGSPATTAGCGGIDYNASLISLPIDQSGI